MKSLILPVTLLLATAALAVLTRIADALESLASAADAKEGELNVYVRGELTTDEEDDDDD